MKNTKNIKKLNETLPCPFCGETFIDHVGIFQIHEGTKWGSVYCSCGARGPDVRTHYDLSDNASWHKDAIKEWNNRNETRGSQND